MTDYGKMGKRALEHIRHLSVDIGPRGSTTEAERRGAEYAAAEMKKWAAEVKVEPFRAFSTLSWPWGLIAVLQVVTGVLLWLSPPAAVAVGAVNLMFHLAVASARIDTGAIFPKRSSQNVWGRVPAKGDSKGGPERRVVFMAHVDTTRASLPYAPKALKNLRGSHVLNVITSTGLFLLAAAGVALATAFSPALLWVRIAGTVLAVVSLYALGVYVHRQLFMPYIAGANDNASGVGLTLALGEHFAAEPLSDTEIWCVVTGCEETGYPSGARHFVDDHLAEMRKAETIVLDNHGAGDLRHLTAEGIIMPLEMDGGLLKLARGVGRRHPEWNARDSVCNLGYTDATPVIVAGCRALAIWAEGPDGFLPNYHWPTDTFEKVDPQTIQRAGQMVTEMVEAIDKGEDRD